uniref:proline--tRNA ligase n=1 Tax=Heterorhabditis bacteriophora TaxID=37862 RepID=A0A1I7XRF5_HETBA
MVIFKASKFILNGITPSPSKSLAQKLLLYHGFIHPVGRGLYSMLPLGQRVIEKLSRLIDNELEVIGALKVSMPILGPRELWEKTNRWSDMGSELMHTCDRTGADMCLQPTAEEMCTQLVAQLPKFKTSHYPLMIYQTTEKFRDEMNPRFGLIRARQFLMKDLYSFDLSESKANQTYELVSNTYEKILKDKLHLEIFRVNADSGVHGDRLSHEYHLRNSLDEDRIQFWTKYSEVLRAVHNGNKPLEMCCFGIGVTRYDSYIKGFPISITIMIITNRIKHKSGEYDVRLLPAAIEALSPLSNTAIRLPKAIAPFDIAVIVTKSLLSNVLVEMVLSTMERRLEGGVLLDDRVEINVGKRLKLLGQLGIPRIVVIGNTTNRTINEVPRMEYFTTEYNSEKLLNKGELSLNELIQVSD